MKNRGNWEKVQLHQKTGSHSYIAHCHAVVSVTIVCPFLLHLPIWFVANIPFALFLDKREI